MTRSLSALLLLIPLASAAEVVVVHPANATAELDRTAVEDIWLGRRTNWPDGGRIVVTVQPEGAVAEGFLRTYLQKTPPQFQTWWKKILFSGKGKPPVECKDDAAVLAAVARDKDAIGFISDATPHDGVKVIAVK